VTIPAYLDFTASITRSEVVSRHDNGSFRVVVLDSHSYDRKDVSFLSRAEAEAYVAGLDAGAKLLGGQVRLEKE
jgi:hypothetical protein